MKINYTLPGFQPENDVSKDLVGSFDSPFKNRMQAFERRQPVAWRDLLGLNQTPPDPSHIAPPETQPGSVSQSAALRQQWRELLGRHAGAAEMASAPPAAQRMLTLLQQYQKDSDGMFSRGLSEAER